MKYCFELTAFADEPDKLIEVAKIEEGKRNRSELAITRKGRQVVFRISAVDYIALKASMNTVSKVLSIYEKTKAMVDEDGR